MVDPAANPESVGVGQQDPTDSVSQFRMLSFIIRQAIAQVDTVKVVQVTAVNPGAGSPPLAGTVDVQILVNQLDGGGNSIKQGVVYGLPYFRLGNGSCAIICDPIVGELGLALCCDRDISNVKSAVSGGNPPQTNPGSLRKYSVSDGVYLGGCLNPAPDLYLWLKDDGTFELKASDGNAITSSATGMTITDMNGNQIQMKPSIVNIVTGALQVNGVPVTVP